MSRYKAVFEAMKFGKDIVPSVEHLQGNREFWSAWKAGRVVAEAFIEKAKALGLDSKTIEEFRELAREVAPE